MEDVAADSVAMENEGAPAGGVENVPTDENAKPEAKVVTPEELASLAARNAIIKEYLDDLGVFAMVQFKDVDNIVSRIQFSEKQPYRTTLIAVFEKLLREFLLSEEIDAQQEIQGRMIIEEARRQQEAKEANKDAAKAASIRSKITEGITH